MRISLLLFTLGMAMAFFALGLAGHGLNEAYPIAALGVATASMFYSIFRMAFL